MKRILIVDDEKVIRNILVLFFSKYDITCITCKNGKEAWKKINKADKAVMPDLVITDFNMPEMNGSELIEKIRNSSKEEIKSLPIILCTGDVKAAKKDNWAKQANKILPKPFELYKIYKYIIELQDLID